MKWVLSYLDLGEFDKPVNVFSGKVKGFFQPDDILRLKENHNSFRHKLSREDLPDSSTNKIDASYFDFKIIILVL